MQGSHLVSDFCRGRKAKDDSGIGAGVGCGRVSHGHHQQRVTQDAGQGGALLESQSLNTDQSTILEGSATDTLCDLGQITPPLGLVPPI